MTLVAAFPHDDGGRDHDHAGAGRHGGDASLARHCDHHDHSFFRGNRSGRSLCARQERQGLAKAERQESEERRAAICVRRLVVLKLWQARDAFDPARLMQKFRDGRDFDWGDLRQLLNRAANIDRDRIAADCVRGYGFLEELAEEERALAQDQYQREQAAAERLRAELVQDHQAI